jgi:prepilin-type N-terminal cleavage/methylation domain-containing protein
MGSRAFSLVELLTVIAIIAILSSIAVLSWNRMTTKGNMEAQIKTVFSDMMTIRSEALYRKRERSVVISGNEFRVYSSSVITSTPLETKKFKFNFAGANTVTFDTSGMTNGVVVAICVDPSPNGAAVDSLVVSQAKIDLGKRGGSCAPTNIQQK